MYGSACDRGWVEQVQVVSASHPSTDKAHRGGHTSIFLYRVSCGSSCELLADQADHERGDHDDGDDGEDDLLEPDLTPSVTRKLRCFFTLGCHEETPNGMIPWRMVIVQFGRNLDLL